MDRPQTRRLICLLLLCGVVIGCDNHKSSTIGNPFRSVAESAKPLTAGSPDEVARFLADNPDKVAQQREIMARRIARDAQRVSPDTGATDTKTADPPAENWLTTVVKAIAAVCFERQN